MLIYIFCSFWSKLAVPLDNYSYHLICDSRPYFSLDTTTWILLTVPSQCISRPWQLQATIHSTKPNNLIDNVFSINELNIPLIHDNRALQCTQQLCWQCHPNISLVRDDYGLQCIQLSQINLLTMFSLSTSSTFFSFATIVCCNAPNNFIDSSVSTYLSSTMIMHFSVFNWDNQDIYPSGLGIPC